MGNHKFRFSSMMPNAWFYKLKDMTKTRNRHHHHHHHHNNPKQQTKSKSKTTSQGRRSSYYFRTEPTKSDKFVVSSPVNPKISDTQFPRKSSSSFSRKKPKRKTIYKPSPSPNFFISSLSSSSSDDDDDEDCESEFDYVSHHYIHDQSPTSDFGTDQDGNEEEVVVSCNWTTDIIIDLDNEKRNKKKKRVDGFDKDSNFITKTPSTMAEFNTHHRKHQRSRKSVSKSTGVRLKSRSNHNSPRIGRRRANNNQEKSRDSVSSSKESSKSFVLEGFAVVKSTVDPERDFRDSMVEMILENGVKKSKDLEDLLACYLSLNSKQYHGVIVKAFEQIWFDLNYHNLQL